MKLTVFLDKQEVLAKTGWYRTERESGVQLLISVYAEMDFPTTENELSHTVDYVELLKSVNEKSAIPRKLLETLASDIIEDVENKYKGILTKIEITIHKKKIHAEDYQANGVGISVIKKY